MQPLDVIFDGLNELGLVLLDGAADLSGYVIKHRRAVQAFERHTFGRTNSELNFENTRNISFAFLAVPSLSRNLAIIWFSTLATRSLYAFSAVTQISVPSAILS